MGKIHSGNGWIMKKQAARLESVAVTEGMTATVAYTDGRSYRIDFSGVARRLDAFAPLENLAEFATVKVADWGWSLEWDCGASLDSDRVLEMALEQAGMADNVAFRHWQDAHNLSLSAAAEEIGLSRRTVSQYRTGARPVPRYIALACKGWEAEHASRR